MTFTNKITELKNFINSTYSSFAGTLTDTYNGDYANSIIFALRTVGKECRICVKTFLIPLVPRVFSYSILPSLYTKNKYDYVRPLKLAIGALAYDTDNNVYQMDYRSNSEIELDTIEKFESTNFDLIGISQKHTQNNSYLKIINGYYETEITYKGRGPISVASTPKTIKILKTNCVATPVAGDLVYNLDNVDTNIQYSVDTIASVSDGSTTWDLVMTNDVVLTTGNYKWVDTDVIAISTGEMMFLSITEQVMPTIDYLGASGDLSGDIPILNQFIDDLNPLCYKYLFGILTVRDPDKVVIYTSLLQSGLIKTEQQVITSFRKRLDTVDTTKARLYNSISNQYGR